MSQQPAAWVGFKIDPEDSAFFDVPVPDDGATYRVRVYTFQREFGRARDPPYRAPYTAS